jgi:hypothetical protein
MINLEETNLAWYNIKVRRCVSGIPQNFIEMMKIFTDLIRFYSTKNNQTALNALLRHVEKANPANLIFRAGFSI